MRTICLLTVALLLPACSGPKPIEDAGATAADREMSVQRRTRAVEQLAADLRNAELAQSHNATREQLKSVVWSRRNPATLRIAAIDALLEHDESDTRTMLGLMVPTETDPTTLEAVCERAVAGGWTEMTAPLVRSWSRPLRGVPVDSRPEPPAVAELNARAPVEDAVFRVFATPAPERSFNDKERRAAWEVLGMLDPTGAAAAERVALLPATDDPLVSAVRSASIDLGGVPVTQEQLEWLTLMREPSNRAFYENAKRLVSSLTNEQRAGLALRHSAALVATEATAAERLRATRAELQSELAQRLSGRTVTTRSADGARGTETLAAAGPELSFGDMLHVLAVDDALRSPKTIALLFEHADRDHADSSTEYGGVLRPTGEAGVYEPVLYPPRPAQRRNDKTFIAAPEMFSQHPDALAHFHFHVQDHRNASYAGPGPGDRSYADAFGRANVVLTFITKDTLAVDYYQPGGATLDLGRVARP